MSVLRRPWAILEVGAAAVSSSGQECRARKFTVLTCCRGQTKAHPMPAKCPAWAPAVRSAPEGGDL